MRPIDASLRRAALLVISASVLGPGVVFVDAALRRPAPWAGPEAFLAGYHWLQAVPPLLGFPLLFGFVLFVAAAKRLDAARGGRVDQAPVLLLTAIYGALVAFNYVANACYVAQAGEDVGAVSALSMNNPRSLCWAIEMYAYAILGVVTWLVAPTFREERAIALLLRANGLVSVASAAVTTFHLPWVLTPIGLGFYAGWNGLIVATMALVARRFGPAVAQTAA
ncbi:MAG: hypothetical protein NDI82_09170 [Anaeromyxobacteraceae bacterium]|nr:hypothetical protein [Anaeromyxobacteraceae bacterium]